MSKAYIYAHLDSNNICNGFCGPGKKRTGSYLVEIPEMDDYYLRKKYNAETGDWEEVEPEPEEPVDPPATDPVLDKLNSIEAKIQTNAEMEEFYNAVCQEVGLV